MSVIYRSAAANYKNCTFCKTRLVVVC